MQLASHGARVITRNAPQTARSIHIPSGIRPHSTGLGQRLFTQTRLALGRFVTHLTTPGTGSASVARSFHAANPSIQQRLSFTARQTLARPLQPRFLPRGPVVPRTMTQVGLGTARNFSSGRPIFQQLADNIPIAGRAFYETDWDLNMQKEKQKMRRPSKKRAVQVASKELLKPTPKAKTTAPSTEAELEHYFPTAAVPDVTTYLLVPLAPTPTARAPLPEFPAGRLPLPALLAIRDSHETHQLRVASLFHRLDTADVWSRGVVCSAYASSADARGVCTILKVEFRGWSKAAVRGVLGESGTGWCVLEETHLNEYDADDDAFSEMSSILSGMGLEAEDAHVPRPQAQAMDPAQSFILPTLDFSSSFLAHSPSPRRTPSDFFVHSNTSSDSDLDLGAWSDDASSIAFVDPPSENGWFVARVGGENPWLETDATSDGGAGWLSFSSDFTQRWAQTQAEATPEPLESVFA
ncbi:hypothetical protein B0H13DRAFT_1708080 [Mycena leptocephala]|nr:hypothetical protein B0H13DRAFT_1708080 [Mycena leptocephala]